MDFRKNTNEKQIISLKMIAGCYLFLSTINYFILFPIFHLHVTKSATIYMKFSVSELFMLNSLILNWYFELYQRFI